MKLITRQSCGFIPVHKWNSGTFDETAIYHDESEDCLLSSGNCPRNCEGSDWVIDLENTKFTVSEDGNKFEARCTMKRSFNKGSMREINYDESLKWMAGYNMY